MFLWVLPVGQNIVSNIDVCLGHFVLKIKHTHEDYVEYISLFHYMLHFRFLGILPI